jgi:hypothetical protein
MKQPHLFVDGERPGLDLFWLNSIGAPVDVTGYNLALTFEQDGVEVNVPQATLTANASPTVDNNSASDVPSVSISFSQHALSDIVPGPLTLRVKAQSQNRHRVFKAELLVDQ